MKVKKIETGTKIFLIGFAVFIDILEVILSLFGVGLITEIASGIFQYGVVGLIFYLHGSIFIMRRKGGKGTSPQTPKNSPGSSNPLEYKISIEQVVGFVIESIPVVGALPIFTFNVWRQINAVNKAAEEEEENTQNSNVLRFSNISQKNQTEQEKIKNPNIVRPIKQKQ